MIGKDDIKRAKIARSVLLIVLLFVSAVAMITVLLVWKGQITGFYALETFESEFPVASGGSPGSALSYTHIPNIKVQEGQRVRFIVDANEDVIFSDSTQLFDVRPDGTVDFVAESLGYHRIFVFVTNSEGEYYFQDFRIIIEE
jgi:hypothetical protein